MKTFINNEIGYKYEIVKHNDKYGLFYELKYYELCNKKWVYISSENRVCEEIILEDFGKEYC